MVGNRWTAWSGVVLVGAESMTSAVSESRQAVDVIIVGAGAAGLAAATMLWDAGRTFVILEADDRIGGRAHSVPLSGGAMYERGAEALQGPRIATWEYVIRHHLTPQFHHGWYLPVLSREPPVAEWRNPPKQFTNGRWSDLILPDEGDLIQRAIAALEDSPTDNASMLDVLRAGGFSVKEIDAIRLRMDVMAPLPLEELEPIAAAKALRADAPQMAMFSLREGYSTLWERMAAPFKERIVTGAPVTRIEQGGSGVRVTAAGQLYAARAAVVTVSVGALQSGEIEFQPQLPERKQQAIKKLRMAPLIKVGAVFRTPFWRKRLDGALAIALEGAAFDLWYDYYYDQEGPPTLMALCGARTANSISGEPDAIKRAFLDPLIAAFSDIDVTGELVQMHVADWPAHRWSRGAVSTVPVGGHLMREALAAPTPPIFWAGEGSATGTEGQAECVDGALATGRRAAIEALHLLREWQSTAKHKPKFDWSVYG